MSDESALYSTLQREAEALKMRTEATEERMETLSKKISEQSLDQCYKVQGVRARYSTGLKNARFLACTFLSVLAAHEKRYTLKKVQLKNAKNVHAQKSTLEARGHLKHAKHAEYFELNFSS